MNYLTIKLFRGNHGHQLKDMFGGLTIAKLYDFKYLHKANEYLDFFALGYNEETLDHFDLLLKRKSKIGVRSNDGLDFNQAQLLFEPYKNKNNHLVVLETATRIHPFQTIKWYQNGLINKNIFEEITRETTEKFRAKHQNYSSYFNNDVINIAMHVDRGVSYNKELWPQNFEHHQNVRYMFPISYYENIYNQITHLLSGQPYKVYIYTEEANSEEIVKVFGTRKDTKLCIGKNRLQKRRTGKILDKIKNRIEDVTLRNSYAFVHDIFYHFVMSDIFIASNSSFSAVVAYYRHGKPMIYHPHKHLLDLPETNYFATDEDGYFDVSRLSTLV